VRGVTAIRALWARYLAGHPFRIGGLALAVVAALAVAWWLGSPLFITTTAQESGVAGAREVARGELQVVDQLHRGSGPVLLLESGGRHTLRFDEVAIQNGPDLHVYLSKDTGGRYIEANTFYVGALKATNGSFNYELPASVDIAQYRSVIVWCRAFVTLFTWADLR
jgi:hypothetical protein